MRFRSLQTRFLVAGFFLVLATAAGGAWTVLILQRVSTAFGQTVRQGQETIDLAARLSDTLEREDDALLLALNGKIRNARSAVAQQRQDFDALYPRLRELLTEPAETSVGQALNDHVQAYRLAGDKLLTQTAKLGTVGDSEQIIDLASTLANGLEREDDALLLASGGKTTKARDQVAEQRRQFDDAYSRLLPHLVESGRQEAGRILRKSVDAYRKAGDALLADAGAGNLRDLYQKGVNPALRKAVAACARVRELSFQTMQDLGHANEFYNQQVNPALRKAVSDCAQIRELNFKAMRDVGWAAQNETSWAKVFVPGVALAALGLTTVVMVLLAHGILRPVSELTRAVEAVRQDDLKTRVYVDSEDELGQLADGFNRMAEKLGDYRESSLGELLSAKSTLEATLAALPDAVFVIDPDEQLVSMNPFAAQVVEALGAKDAASLEHLPFPPSVSSEVKATLRGERPGGVRPDLNQAIQVNLDGRPKKLLVAVVPIPQFIRRRPGAAIVIHDVTEFARLDELRTDVLAVASHELKTPLTSLQMNLLMLQEKADNLTPRQREILKAAVAGGDELAATIDELLDLTRIEAGQLQLTKQRVDFVELVEQVVQNLRPRFQDAQVDLRVVNDGGAAYVVGDPARLRLVLVNLLTNALKYTPAKGQVTVCLASGQNAGASGDFRLHFTLTDTGPGVPPELRERVFERFYRVEDHHPDGLKGVRGTGIGLYLCREIIAAHGGSIRCESGDNGHGTRIAITLNQAASA
jgi:NtrC-family two-component system sensor histidine kinase KinB